MKKRARMEEKKDNLRCICMVAEQIGALRKLQNVANGREERTITALLEVIKEIPNRSFHIENGRDRKC